MKIKLGMFLILTAYQHVLASSIGCYPVMICELIRELGVNAEEIDLTPQIKGDPHHYKLTTKDLKQIIKMPIYITGPIELWTPSEKINSLRPSKNLKTLVLKFNEDYQALAPRFGNNRHALSHFWLYPKIHCHAREQVYQFLSQLKKLPPPTNCPYQLNEANMAKLKNKFAQAHFVFSHDALVPLFLAYGLKANALNSSSHNGHHQIDLAKNLSKRSPNEKFIWIIEKSIQEPHLFKKRFQQHNDLHIEINTLGQLGQKVRPLDELIQKLEALP